MSVPLLLRNTNLISRSFSMHIIILSLVLFLTPVICISETAKNDSLATNPSEEVPNEDELELILRVKVDKIILGDTFAIQLHGKMFIGLDSFFQIMDFPINLDINNKSASGWFIRDSYDFSMETSVDTEEPIILKVKGKKTTLENSAFRFLNDDIYVDAEQFFPLLAIDYIFNFNDLMLVITPSEPFPIQLKLARKDKIPPNSKNLSAQYQQIYRPYRLLSLPFFDMQTVFVTNSLGRNSSGYSALGSGDLAYMTGTYFLRGDQDNALKQLRLTLSKDSLKKNLLGQLKATHFSVGDIVPSPNGGVGNGGQELGARITNRSNGRVIKLNTTDFTGNAQPGWDVELYRNNIFLTSQTIGESGRYEFFDQDVLYGNNEFSLIFYGPQGQREEKNEYVNLTGGSGMLQDIIYDVSLTAQNSQLFNVNDRTPKTEVQHNRFNFNLYKSFGRTFSLQTAYTSFTFSDGIKHHFIQPAMRVFLFNTLVDISSTNDLAGGYSLYTSLAKGFGQHALLTSRSVNSSNFQTEASVNKAALLINRFTLSGPMLSAKLLKIFYSFDGVLSELRNNNSKQDYNFNLASSFGKIKLNNRSNYSVSRQDNGNVSRSLGGATSISTFYYRFGLRAGTSYLFNTSRNFGFNQITNINGNISWLVSSKLRAQYGYRYNLARSVASHSLAFNWRAKHFNIVSNIIYNDNNSYTAYVGLNFSIGYDGNTSALDIGPDRISNTGAISAKIYSDNNNNGQFDPEESLLAGAKIQAIQARKSAESNKNGKIFLLGLPTDRVTDIELDKESMNDPFLVSIKPGFSLLPRPGLIESIEIPVVNSGEIEGTTYIETVKTAHVREAGYVPLVLQNIKTRDKYQTSSAYDGFFLFSQVPPGKYLVSVDADYLKRFNYIVAKPARKLVEVTGEGNVVMGADFTLYAEAE